MTDIVFVTDLHGKTGRYDALFKYIVTSPPDVLLIGGDILPPFTDQKSFINGYLKKNISLVKDKLGDSYPLVLVIMGNDDPRINEETLITAGSGIWEYLHHHELLFEGYKFFGYSYVPPTPFLLKDWERYDVSRYIDPGCVEPEAGSRTVPVSDQDRTWTTIKKDLDLIAGEKDLENAVFLFHAPPYNTSLDLGDVGGKMIDHVPVDEHLGSIAVQRFIKEHQPLLTLHGHIHESPRLSGRWLEKIGRTVCINGAHDGEELSVIRLDLEAPESAERLLI